MKVLITGTHFTPAQAVIEQLKKYPNTQIIYVGRKTTTEGDSSSSVESEVLPKLGVKFIPIIAGRLSHYLSFYTIISLFKIPIGFLQAFWIVFSQKPDVILSFGGYVSVPVVFAGWLLSIPIIIHEQTLVTGLASKITSFFANKIALSFDLKKDEKTILTGNPLRKNILNPNQKLPPNYQKLFDEARKANLPVILFTGGNQGSHKINKSIEGGFERLVKIGCVIHASGGANPKDYERLEKLQNNRYIVEKWIDDSWGAILSKVDMVVSRAGINTLYEIAYFGKPSLVIPIPYLYQDEQNRNAKYFELLGLVKILPQSKLSFNTLLESIKVMLKDLDKLKIKAQNAKKVIIPDAAKRLAVESLILADRI